MVKEKEIMWETQLTKHARLIAACKECKYGFDLVNNNTWVISSAHAKVQTPDTCMYCVCMWSTFESFDMWMTYYVKI